MTCLDLDSDDLSWTDAVLPGEEGLYDHAGSNLPEAVGLRLGGRVVAVADPFDLHLVNEYCYDSEYYLVLRLREILDREAWAASPFGQVAEGRIVLAFDKFHGLEYLEDGPMSYGGDFEDLQLLVDGHPRNCRRISDASVLRAVRDRDVELLRDLLARGGNLNAGWEVVDEALRSVSVDRNSTALWEAVLSDDLELLEVLLQAGARLDAPPGLATPLQGAVWNHKKEAEALLRRYGAT